MKPLIITPLSQKQAEKLIREDLIKTLNTEPYTDVTFEKEGEVDIGFEAPHTGKYLINGKEYNLKAGDTVSM